MVSLLLLVAAIPFVLVGVVRLASRILRFVRTHRGEISAGLIIDELRGQFADSLEQWADEPTGWHDGGEHHHDAIDHHSPHGH